MKEFGNKCWKVSDIEETILFLQKFVSLCKMSAEFFGCIHTRFVYKYSVYVLLLIILPCLITDVMYHDEHYTILSLINALPLLQFL